MSDNSDWESDSDVEEQPPTQTHQTPTATNPNTAATAATAGSVPTPTSTSNVSVPPILLALPITLALKGHPALANGIPAGITLLYDAAKNVSTILVYDQHKRPMVVEALDGTKLLSRPSSSLPLDFTPIESSPASASGPSPTTAAASIIDGQGRKWSVTFESHAAMDRFIAVLSVASVIAKAAASNVNLTQSLVKVDTSKGSGKSCKSGLYARLRVRAWIVEVGAGDGASPIARVGAGQTITDFNPTLQLVEKGASASTVPITAPMFDTTLSDVKVAEAEGENSTLGCCLTGGGGKLKIDGGSRLLALPARSNLISNVWSQVPAQDQYATLPILSSTAIALLHIVPLAVSKKRERKEKKKEKTSTTPVPVAADAASASTDHSVGEKAASSSASSSASITVGSIAEPVPTPVQPASPPSDWLHWRSDLSSSLSSLRSSLVELDAQLSALPSIQHRIAKAVAKDVYEGLIEGLGLQQALDAQSGAGSDVDAAQLKTLEVVQANMRGIVSSFVRHNNEGNATTTKGTIASLVAAWKGDGRDNSNAFQASIHHLVADDAGLLSSSRLDSLASSFSTAVSTSTHVDPAAQSKLHALQTQYNALSKSHAKLLQSLEAKEKEMKNLLKEQKQLQDKHNVLLMDKVDLEDRCSKLSSSLSVVEQKAAACEVFEKGLTEMRTMLDQEVEGRREAEKSFSDLLHLQKNYKYIWLPDKNWPSCMNCREKFSRFAGRSKGHCRFCGRIFCKSCCTECELPELGYSGRVKVCKPCAEFRTGRGGCFAGPDGAENAAASNGAIDGDGVGGDGSDDDFRPLPSAATSSTKNKNTKTPKKKQEGGALSYDSDFFDED